MKQRKLKQALNTEKKDKCVRDLREFNIRRRKPKQALKEENLSNDDQKKNNKFLHLGQRKFVVYHCLSVVRL